MVNKPAVPKNLFYVNFILELTSLFGAEAVTKICSKFGMIYTIFRLWCTFTIRCSKNSNKMVKHNCD